MKNIFLLILTAIVLMYTSCSSESQNSHKDNKVIKKTTHEITKGVKQLLNSEVCMVNDRFMNKEQIPVPVANKTYYGCCEGCVTALKNDTASRYSFDMVTREKVDKSNAVIIIKPGTSDEVLYFASEANAKRYVEQQERR